MVKKLKSGDIYSDIHENRREIRGITALTGVRSRLDLLSFQILLLIKKTHIIDKKSRIRVLLPPVRCAIAVPIPCYVPVAILMSNVNLQEKTGEAPETMTQKDAMMFPVIASCALFSLYIFFQVVPTVKHLRLNIFPK